MKNILVWPECKSFSSGLVYQSFITFFFDVDMSSDKQTNTNYQNKSQSIHFKNTLVTFKKSHLENVKMKLTTSKQFPHFSGLNL